jgi:hypothetical protein
MWRRARRRGGEPETNFVGERVTSGMSSSVVGLAAVEAVGQRGPRAQVAFPEQSDMLC